MACRKVQSPFTTIEGNLKLNIRISDHGLGAGFRQALMLLHGEFLRMVAVSRALKLCRAIASLFGPVVALPTHVDARWTIAGCGNAESAICTGAGDGSVAPGSSQ